MRTIQGVLMMVVLACMASSAFTVSAATISSASEAATVCEAQAASQYAGGEQPARVKFKGSYGPNDRVKVRMQVLPPQGQPFLAVREVNGHTGGIVGLMPAAGAVRPSLHA
jgi:hypothetical protein